jgi:hypothetical protein
LSNRREEELEGTTFVVYHYAIKKAKPIDTRDVVRDLGLSSSSVAYRHLQKLEGLELLEKNAYGEYFVKEKTSIRAHVWIGRNFVPRLLLYFLFFLGLLVVEVLAVVIRFSWTKTLETNLIYLTVITGLAMVLFLVEGIILQSKGKPN